jgi:hypothetical protein
VLKSLAFILLLAHGIAAMAQTVGGNVFCAGTAYDPSPASVSISGTVAASDVGLPGAIWVGIEDPGVPGYPAAFLTTQWLGSLDDRRLFHLRRNTGNGVNFFVLRVHPKHHQPGVAVPQPVPILLVGKSMRAMAS